MLKTLTELCTYLHNWFNQGKERIYGTVVIEGGAITHSDFLSMIQNGQYYRIVGSVFNDGVYKYEADKPMELHDETFVGAIWLMAIPQEVLNLADEISAWKEKNEAIDSPNMSPFNSESFGGYSYSKSSGSSNGGVSAITWQGFFASKLNDWRKLR